MVMRIMVMIMTMVMRIVVMIMMIVMRMMMVIMMMMMMIVNCDYSHLHWITLNILMMMMMMTRIMGMLMMMVMRVVMMRIMMMVKRGNVGYDEDDNDIFQEGIIQNSVGLRTLVRTGRPNMMTMMMEEDEGEDDDGDELTHPSKSACDLHQLTWGCGRPVFNEIIRNDPITHL